MRNFLIFLMATLFAFEIFACGHHDAWYPLNQDSGDKQFPDRRTTYSPHNPAHRGWSQYLSRSLHGTRKMVLTFDDGPHPINTPRLLDILKRHQVKATFFTLGPLIKRYPQIAARIVREGHILAGHDWQHTNSNTETEAVFKEGLAANVREVKKYYVEREMYYRFPYGAYGRPQNGNYHHFNAMKQVAQNLFGENCINFVFWDIDTSDWVGNMTSENIVQTLMANLEGGQAWRFKKATVNGRTTYVKEAFKINDPLSGGVVLMHDIHTRTVEATELFLERIKTTNIEIVPLNQVEEFAYGNAVCELLNGVLPEL